MKIDITLRLTKEMLRTDTAKGDPILTGHLGTHFDVADKEFPLAYTYRKGVVFDVSFVKDREIASSDIDLSAVEADTFVAFYTGYIEEKTYGTKEYYAEHPQLTFELIDALTARGVSVIGLDFAGIRRGKEHLPADFSCASKGTFVVENLCNLERLLSHPRFYVHTYPMNMEGMSGLPCRVIAEIEE